MRPKNAILKQQAKLESAMTSEVKFRNLGRHGESVVDEVQWKTLTRIFKFGLDVGLSRSQGDGLLKMMQDVLNDNGSSIQLRKTWRSLENAIEQQKVKGAYKVARFSYNLPRQYFGTRHWRSKGPLRCFRASAIDIKCILSDILLNVKDPASQCKFVYETPKDVTGNPIPRDNQILEGFSTGDRFKSISDYYNALPPIDGLKVVPILLKVALDDTTLSASRVTSECPVYLSIMNIEGLEQPLHHLGFAPRHPPYSDDDLRQQLGHHGVKTIAHQVRE